MFSSDFLRQEWDALSMQFNESKDNNAQMFDRIVQQYGEKSRHYHNLHHIEHFIKLSKRYRNKLANPIAFDFAIWYHDIIYKQFRKDNEIKSAQFARKEMELLDIDEEIIARTEQLIIQTQSHLSTHFHDFDTLLFLDADLQILGEKPDRYLEYTKQVRKEYSSIPDFIFYPKRKSFLETVLKNPKIFQTHDFFNEYETQARENIVTEIRRII